MPRGTELSVFERGEIIGLKKANFSYREIANILNRSKTAVEHTINDYFKKNKTTAALKTGRPKKLSKMWWKTTKKISQNYTWGQKVN